MPYQDEGPEILQHDILWGEKLFLRKNLLEQIEHKAAAEWEIYMRDR